MTQATNLDNGHTQTVKTELVKSSVELQLRPQLRQHLVWNPFYSSLLKKL